MISHRFWRNPWQPVIASHNVNRFELLNDMWALHDWCFRVGNTRAKVPHDLVLRVAHHRVLNAAQFSRLTLRSRQTATKWVYELNLADYFDDPCAAGVFDPGQLDYMMHLITRLSTGEEPSTEDIAKLQKCGDPAIVSIFTGVPINTIRRAKKGLPV